MIVKLNIKIYIFYKCKIKIYIKNIFTHGRNVRSNVTLMTHVTLIEGVLWRFIYSWFYVRNRNGAKCPSPFIKIHKFFIITFLQL